MFQISEKKSEGTALLAGALILKPFWVMGFRVNKNRRLKFVLDRRYGNLDLLKTPVPI